MHKVKSKGTKSNSDAKTVDNNKAEKKMESKMRAPIPKHLATEETKIDWSAPVDFTFKRLTKFEKLEPETANTDRLGRIDRGNENKYLSKSLWINNNSLEDTKNIDETIKSLMQYPEKLSFLNLSFNELKEINGDLLKFPNLNILYLHGNKLNDIQDIVKLRKLKNLHVLTLYGNPLYNDKSLGDIRAVIAQLLPQLRKLDYNGISKLERTSPVKKKIGDLIEKPIKGFQPLTIDKTKIKRKDLCGEKNVNGNKKDRSTIKNKKLTDNAILGNHDIKSKKEKGDLKNKQEELKMYEPILISKCVCE